MNEDRDVRKVIIMGAAGRDFHNFNVYFRDNPRFKVVAFTATQIPFIEGRVYPPELAGSLYPGGIPIYNEDMLPELIRRHNVTDVYFSYSDVSHNYVMNRASLVNSLGASFHLLGPKDTMLESSLPVIAVTAMRTGAGKSPTSRYIARIVRDMGLRIGIVRHPMPYGDLIKQKAVKFSSLDDLDRLNVTIEEREDYEPHIRNGFTVYSGVDYSEVLRMAEDENDALLWDGGNNDYPFIKPDIYICVVDPYRWRHIDTYYPGEVNIRSADILVVTKVDTARREDVESAIAKLRELNRDAEIVKCPIRIIPDKDVDIAGKRVVVVEDGPTVTHGEMGFGAGYIYSIKKDAEIVDPRAYFIGSIKDTLEKYPHISMVVPAIGYSGRQIRELEEILNRIDADIVVAATPTILERYININKPIIHIYYELDDESGRLGDLIRYKLGKIIGRRNRKS